MFILAVLTFNADCDKLKERNPNRGNKVCLSRNIQDPSLAAGDLNALEQ
jgi:hypothetical protein